MKKIIAAFIPLMMFSLVGCNKSSAVTYKEISEDEFNAYYTDEKKAEAIDKLDSYSTFSVKYTKTQRFNDGRRYDTNETLEVDANYAYYFRRDIQGYEGELTDTTTQELALANSTDVNLSDYYKTVFDNVAKSYLERTRSTGAEAKNKYLLFESQLRTIEKAQVENPVAVKFNLTYYKGSDGTLKVTSINDTGTMNYTYVIDSKTLFLKNHSLVEVGSDYELKYINVYKQNMKVDHKKPTDIGYDK